MQDKILVEKLAGLSDDLKQEVLDYIDFLSQKYSKKKNVKRFRFDWEGGLSELKGKYTSVELQHKAMEWR